MQLIHYLYYVFMLYGYICHHFMILGEENVFLLIVNYTNFLLKLLIAFFLYEKKENHLLLLLVPRDITGSTLRIERGKKEWEQHSDPKFLAINVSLYLLLYFLVSCNKKNKPTSLAWIETENNLQKS